MKVIDRTGVTVDLDTATRIVMRYDEVDVYVNNAKYVFQTGRCHCEALYTSLCDAAGMDRATGRKPVPKYVMTPSHDIITPDGRTLSRWEDAYTELNRLLDTK